jgi:hypothetical protein
MNVKSITYKRMIGDTFYHQSILSSEKMDDHMAQMLNDGWEIKSQFQKDDKIIITYAKK